MVDENESNSVTKPSDTYEEAERKHEVEGRGSFDQPRSKNMRKMLNRQTI